MANAGMDEGQVDTILEILSDRYCRRIIHSIIDQPKSAFEISLVSGILLSTVYRKLKMLQNYKLLSTRCLLRDDGKKLFLYQSKIRSISARLGKDLLDVEVEPNSQFIQTARTQAGTAGI